MGRRLQSSAHLASEFVAADDPKHVEAAQGVDRGQSSAGTVLRFHRWRGPRGTSKGVVDRGIRTREGSQNPALRSEKLGTWPIRGRVEFRAANEEDRRADKGGRDVAETP